MDGAGAFAASHHAVLTRREAADLHLPRSALAHLRRDGLLREPSRDVFVASWAPTTWRQRLYIATRAAGGGVTVSHRAAAQLHRIDGFEHGLVEVTVRKGRRLRIDGCITHQTTRSWANDDVVVIDGVRCTSLARTLVDLPTVVDDLLVERALDDFQRRGLSLNWLERTARRLHRPGQRGTRVILDELDRRRHAGRVRDSWFEKLVEASLASIWLPPIVRQHEVYDEDGNLIARLDLAVPIVRLGIEAHSRAFHTGAHRERIDERRDTRLAMVGWDVQYVGWSDTMTPRAVLRSVEAIVARRALDLGIDLPSR